MCAGYLVGCGWWGDWWVVGVLVPGSGSWVGVRFPGRGCLVGGLVCLAGPGAWWVGDVTCGGLFPLDPSLTPAPTCLAGCGSWFGSSLCWAVQAVGWWAFSCCSSFLGGWAGLVGGLSCWLCPGWVVLNLGSWLRFSLAVEVRPSVGRGLFPGWGLRGLCPVSGGCSRACRVVPVGRADLDGRALRRPPFPPHNTRRPVSDPRIRWANSHVKTLTDRRSSVSGTHTFRLYHAV